MNNIVTQRFVECHNLLKERNGVRSSRQFALALDYAPQSLNDILKGKRDVTIELLRKAIAKFDFNPSFLFAGQGTPFSKDVQEGINKVLTIVTDEHNEERIVHVPVSAQAGYGGNITNATYFEDLPTFSLPDYRFKDGTHRCFDISGDSMEPTLYSGDKVVCSYLEKEGWQRSIKDNIVCVVVTKDDVVVKRLVNKILDSGHIQLFSDNSYYQPYVIPVEEIEEIWTVRVKISPFMPSPSNVRNGLHDEIASFRKTIDQQTHLIKELNSTIELLLRKQRASI